MRASPFKDITLTWDAEPVVIPANRVMGAIATIEEVVTLGELQMYALRGSPPMAKLCQAYGAVLRYAGLDITDDEVYASVFSGGQGEGADLARSVQGLLLMMIPPAALTRGVKVPKGGNVTPTAASSKKRTKRQSVTVG